MSLSVITPPTFRELLKDPVLKPYILRAPRLPMPNPPAEPFRVWGIRHDGKWAGKNAPSYREAFELIKKMLAKPDVYEDVTIISRPVQFGPPSGYEMPRGLQWCGHCRRPSVFRRTRLHPAMKRWEVVSDDDTTRCYYCAARPQRVWHW